MVSDSKMTFFSSSSHVTDKHNVGHVNEVDCPSELIKIIIKAQYNDIGPDVGLLILAVELEDFT